MNALRRSCIAPLVLSLRSLMVGASVLLIGAVGCAPTSRVSSYHQRCLECALRRSGNPLEVAEAHRYFAEGCQDGDARSCSVLGVMVEQGRGVAADPTRALGLYRYACERGNSDGCVNLGRLVEERDVAGAVVAYEVACAARHPNACQRLASARRSLAKAGGYDEPEAPGRLHRSR